MSIKRTRSLSNNENKLLAQLMKEILNTHFVKMRRHPYNKHLN